MSSATPEAVEALLDAAFGADRLTRTAYRLRAGTRPIASLSFSAWSDAGLLGSLQCWPVRWQPDDALAVPMIMVGPVAVRPEWQRSGIGRAMMNALIAAADRHAQGALMMIGDPEYYGRFFGFSALATGAWRLPGPVEPHRLLARVANGHRIPDGAGDIRPDPARD